jgi:hypothetical protein
VEALASTFGFDHAFAVDSDGRSGGLGIYWNNDISIDVLCYSKYHIDVSASGIGVIPWRLTSVYGEAQTSERYRTWNVMKDIASTSSLPWLCLGDFNEVLHADEHEGVGHRTLTQMQGFRETVDICNLIDLGYKGHFWTWERRVTGGTYTRVRLDQALGSTEWSAQFPLACVTHIDTVTLDHSALMIQLSEEEITRRCGIQFRYETMWERHENLKPTISAGWPSGNVTLGGVSAVDSVHQKLTDLAQDLSKWGKETFGSVRKEIKNLKQELSRLRSLPMRVGPSHTEIKISDRLVELYHREEIMWRQRSRVDWLSHGDKNSKFFHQRASMRRRKNMIKSLTSSDGTIVDDKAEMRTMTADFYKNLFYFRRGARHAQGP